MTEHVSGTQDMLWSTSCPPPACALRPSPAPPPGTVPRMTHLYTQHGRDFLARPQCRQLRTTSQKLPMFFVLTHLQLSASLHPVGFKHSSSSSPLFPPPPLPPSLRQIKSPTQAPPEGTTVLSTLQVARRQPEPSSFGGGSDVTEG